MSLRQMSVFALLLALLTVAFPTAGQATMDHGVDISAPSLWERILQAIEWAEQVLDDVAQQFELKEGAGMTTGG